jgi:hypothetical protein
LKVKVFYHEKCFDGASSAALFSRFYRERIREDVDFVFSGLLHRAGALFNESDFDGDENAIVDFKYSSSPKITCGLIIIRAPFSRPKTRPTSSVIRAIGNSTILISNPAPASSP